MNAGTMTGYHKNEYEVGLDAAIKADMERTGQTKGEVMNQASNDIVGWGKDFVTDALDFVGWGTARRQREYELQLANTAYQRAVKDMRAAGLNPAQLYAGGGQTAQTTGYGSTQAAGLGGVAGVLNGIANVASSFNNDKSKTNNMNSSQAIKFAAKVIKIMK